MPRVCAIACPGRVRSSSCDYNEFANTSGYLLALGGRGIHPLLGLAPPRHKRGVRNGTPKAGEDPWQPLRSLQRS